MNEFKMFGKLFSKLFIKNKPRRVLIENILTIPLAFILAIFVYESVSVKAIIFGLFFGFIFIKLVSFIVRHFSEMYRVKFLRSLFFIALSIYILILILIYSTSKDTGFFYAILLPITNLLLVTTAFLEVIYIVFVPKK